LTRRSLWLPRASRTEPHALAEQRERDRRVRLAVAGLPEHERLVTALFYIGDYPQKQIAAFLDLPLTTVKKRLFSARRRLKQALQETLMDDAAYGATARDEDNEPNLRRALQSGAGRPSDDPAFARNVRFWTAVDAGDAASVRALLAADPALARAMNADGETALHGAAAHGQLEIVDALLVSGADPDAVRASDRATPLHTLATGCAQKHIAERLLSAGADFEARNANEQTPLTLAARCTLAPGDEQTADFWSLAAFLVEQGASLDIFAAAALDKSREAGALLDKDPNLVHARDADGATPPALGRPDRLSQGGEGTARPRGRPERARHPWPHAAPPRCPTRRARPGTRPRPWTDLLRDQPGIEVDIFAAALLGDVELIERLLATIPPSSTPATPPSGRDPAAAGRLERPSGCGRAPDRTWRRPYGNRWPGRSAVSVRYPERLSDYDRDIVDLLLHHGTPLDLPAALVLGRHETAAALLQANPSLATPEIVSWVAEHLADPACCPPAGRSWRDLQRLQCRRSGTDRPRARSD
jgi:hypothetical protein